MLLLLSFQKNIYFHGVSINPARYASAKPSRDLPYDTSTMAVASGGARGAVAPPPPSQKTTIEE